MKKEDLDEYVKCLAGKRGCPMHSVNRNKAHWDLINPFSPGVLYKGRQL